MIGATLRMAGTKPSHRLTGDLRPRRHDGDLGPGRLQHWPERVIRCQRERPAGRDAGPGQYTLVPEATPPGPPRNVAQAYRRAAHAFASGTGFEVDFDLAVTRHTLIDAIEHSAAEGRVVTL